MSKLNIPKSKVSIDREYNTIEVIEDYTIGDILKSAKALTLEREEEMEAEVRKKGEEWMKVRGFYCYGDIIQRKAQNSTYLKERFSYATNPWLLKARGSLYVC